MEMDRGLPRESSLCVRLSERTQVTLNRQAYGELLTMSVVNKVRLLTQP